MAKEKILFVDEPFAYGFGTVGLKCLADAFGKLGFEPVMLDILNPDSRNVLQTSLQQRSSFALALSFGRGLSFKIEDRYIHELFDIPHFVCLVDHPLYKMGFTDFRLDNVIYGFSDRTHAAFATSYFRTGRYVFLPHFALTPPLDSLSEAEFMARNQSLFFSGNAAIMGREWSINLASADQMAIIHRMRTDKLPVDEFFSLHLSEDHSVLDTALLNFIDDHPLSLEARNFYAQNFPAVFRDIDIAIRALRRRKIVASLSGLPLTVMGEGWDGAQYLNTSSTTILPPRPYLECERSRREYQLSLHISQGQVFGSHDRVLNSTAAGQAVLASNSRYFEGEFQSPNMCFYSFRDGDVRERYEFLLNNDARYEMAMKGLSYLKCGFHLPEQTAISILTFLIEEKFLDRSAIPGNMQ